MSRRIVPALLFVAMLGPAEALALACQSQANGNWDAPATWTACGGGFPGAADTVTISGGDVVSLNISNAAATSIQLGGTTGGSGNGRINFTAGSALAVSGTLTFGNGARNGTIVMTAGGTLSAGSVVANNIGTWTPGTGTVALTSTNTLPNNTEFDTFNNLVASSGTTSLSRAITVNGDFAVASGAGWDSAGNTVDLNGDFTNNGAFADSGATFLFSGGALQSLTGTNGGTTTFTNLTLNNGNNLQLSGTHDVTVTGTLTLSNGVLITNANTVYVSSGNAIASAGGNDFVQGNLKKPFDPANPSRTFEVGTGTTYSPVTVTFASVTGAGDLTVSSTAGSHPQLGTSGIDTATPAKLNRWYTLSNSATAPVSFTTYDATFTYVAGDRDAAANSAAFLAMRFAGGAWNPTFLGSVPTNTSLTVTGETGFGDFAIGDGAGSNVLAGSGGRFNAYDPSPLNPAGAVNGYIGTKLVGSLFTLTLVHTNAGGTALNNINTAVTVDLMDATDNTGAFANNCGPNWTVLQSGAANFAGNTSSADFTATTAAKEVRVRISGGGQTGCSTDRFSIRPQAFAITSSASNNNDSGAPTIKAGTNFTISADGGPGYTGTPAIDTSQVAGSPTAGTLAGAFAAAVGGVAAGNSFTYSEVGNIGLNANAVTDQLFTLVDQPSGCTPDFSNAPVNGRLGCYIGHAAISQTTGSSGFGRFIPDHFVATFNPASAITNRVAAACASSSFTYMNEALQATFQLQAVNSSNATTQNYQNSYAKLDLSDITKLNIEAASGATFFGALARLDTSGGSTGAFSSGIANVVTAKIAIKRAVPDNPDGPFATKIGIAPQDTDGVTLLSSAFDMDADGTAGTDHLQIGAGTTSIRFGRLRLQNAIGSERLALAIPIQLQYWSGTGFTLNTDDSCTTLLRSDIALDFNPPSNLTACETAVGQASMVFAGGLPSAPLTLNAPGVGNAGAVSLKVNLASAAGNYCNPGSFVAATSAARSYLLGRWDDSADTDSDANTRYDDPPAARAAFGLYGGRPSNFIFQRENF